MPNGDGTGPWGTWARRRNNGTFQNGMDRQGIMNQSGPNGMAPNGRNDGTFQNGMGRQRRMDGTGPAGIGFKRRNGCHNGNQWNGCRRGNLNGTSPDIQPEQPQGEKKENV